MELIDAVSTAVQYLTELYKDKDIANVMLEEVERDEQTDDWYITLGFDLVGGITIVKTKFVPRKSERLYKVIRVNSVTGKVMSMKIRTVPQ